MSQKQTNIWNNFFGPDPLFNRVTDLRAFVPKNNQNLMETKKEAQILAAKLNKSNPSIIEFHAQDVVTSTPLKLSKQASLDEKGIKRQLTFASVVASSSACNLHHNHCVFCESNREGFSVYSTHTTDNCLILKKYVCPICGIKGHTISHCKFNSTGSSVVTSMRRQDQLSRLYPSDFL
ncbi:uncharacterized protein LOC134827637 [Culicoides brevitarsis]|uniref:uncharacterized protein LOC134827637 n=1 Tax=Culicoides brevitarsis TaxID=469753 RepID=UPI00307C03BE